MSVRRETLTTLVVLLALALRLAVQQVRDIP